MRVKGTSKGAVLTVMQSFKEPRAQTNPYVTQLRDCLVATPGVQPVAFSWRAALTQRLDVFHAHWPESLIEQRGPVSTLGRRILYALFLFRLRLQGIPIVRTVHNLELPQGISRVDRWLLLETERLTRVRIVLNEFTPVPDGSPVVLVEHGHYRDWFSVYPLPDSVPGRVAFFGKIRRYKNVEGLVRAFRSLEPADHGLTLHVVGSPSSAELAQSLEEIAGDDPRVELKLGFVEDATLVREVGEATVVVLPYAEMHNSGSVLAALSLGRSVLVPDNEFNRALDSEVGHGWVLRYQGELTASDIESAVARAAAREDGSRPDLSRREWSQAGAKHVEAYRRALES